MKAMGIDDIRSLFIDYFKERSHRVVRSYSLIPPDDPTLYFVNAGMVQFKDIFVGARTVDYVRATSSQKCLRVSGKHNDLENVGRTARHHTLFEMLGNFSFGDYFKEEAIEYAWEFITEKLAFPVANLHVTVHPEDDEARQLWLNNSTLPIERIHDDPENFWSMGDTGPCGPCSEIHFDLGPEFSGGQDLPFGHKDAEDRYIEFWNLVFMQYDRDASGTLNPLPKPSIDTGSGLERLAMILQGTATNYETDAFLPMIERVAERAGVTYGAGGEPDVALRVIADHSRAAAFLIADGIYPDNDGRGYVLRRVMRRAIRFGRMLGFTEPFLVDSTAHVVEMMGTHYPELVAGAETIRRIVLQEETRFGRTINSGLKRLNEELSQLEAASGKLLDGRIAFELYDTYGFPPDLTRLICQENDIEMDQAGFDAGMTEQRERARAASKFHAGDTSTYQSLVEQGLTTSFTGYAESEGQSEVSAILVGGARVSRAAPGSRVELIITRSPFYPEGGGQVGDSGWITTADGVTIEVSDTQKPFGDLIIHIGTVSDGVLDEGSEVTLRVDNSARTHTRKNHSATHLLHLALREILGDHVRQRGSLVAPDRLRFDFSHSSGLSREEIRSVEVRVNTLILENEAVEAKVMPFDDAMAHGAIAFFEEKYGDNVRMLKVGHESTELCGGLHVDRTGDIGLFKIVSEGAISSGVRRLEAVTGFNAVAWVQQADSRLRDAADSLHVGVEQVGERLEKLQQERKEMAQTVKNLKTRLSVAEAQSSLAKAREIGTFKVAHVRLDGVPGKELRTVAENLRDQLGGPGSIMVCGASGDKVSLIVACTKTASSALHAGKTVGELASFVGGRGGGRPDFAQAGGGDANGLDAARDRFFELAETAFG